MTSRKWGLVLRVVGVAVALSVAIFDLEVWQIIVVAIGVGTAQLGVAIQYKEIDRDPRT